MSDILVSVVEMECPICGDVHFVEERECDCRSVINGKMIEYKKEYYRCTNREDDNEFIPVETMRKNLSLAREKYMFNKE